MRKSDDWKTYFYMALDPLSLCLLIRRRTSTYYASISCTSPFYCLPIYWRNNREINCRKLGFRAAALHSGKTQEQREQALEDFKEGNVDVLVATDVAGRGLDVKGVTHVINYDMPKSIDGTTILTINFATSTYNLLVADYTHRIGRTGRAGATGLATSFLTNEDTDIMYDLKQMLQKTNNIVPKELAEHPAAQVKPGIILYNFYTKYIYTYVPLNRFSSTSKARDCYFCPIRLLQQY